MVGSASLAVSVVCGRWGRRAAVAAAGGVPVPAAAPRVVLLLRGALVGVGRTLRGGRGGCRPLLGGAGRLLQDGLDLLERLGRLGVDLRGLLLRLLEDVLLLDDDLRLVLLGVAEGRADLVEL